MNLMIFEKDVHFDILRVVGAVRLGQEIGQKKQTWASLQFELLLPRSVLSPKTFFTPIRKTNNKNL